MQKPPFELEVARAIATAAKTFDRPDTPAWITPPLFWQVQLAEYYYTGLRSGTVLNLQCKHFEDKGQVPILNVPGDIVFKTSKPIQVAVHPQLVTLLRDVTRNRDPEDPVLPEACSYSHLLDLHEELQRAAGLTKEQIQSLHAWRRTHGNQMALLGADEGIKIAQAALDHADERTTRKSYVNQVFLNRLRVKLPELWPRRLFD
jgi:integrase